METVELAILVGIQASGKTTYFRRHLAGEYVHVSLDNWRGRGGIRKKEREAILAGLRAAAGSGGRTLGVVVDNTNITAATRQRYFEYARQFQAEGGEVRVAAYFFDADLPGCLERNAQRPPAAEAGTPYFVPPPAIRRFYRLLEPPDLAEGFDAVFRVRIGSGGDFEVTQPG